MYVVVLIVLWEKVILLLQVLWVMFNEKVVVFRDIVKIGCIYLQDVMLFILGQEIFGWVVMLDYSLKYIEVSQLYFVELVLGGMVVGIGLNIYLEYVVWVVVELVLFSGQLFVIVLNKFEVLVIVDVLVYVYGVLKGLVVLLMKIVNDVCWLVFGFCCGIGEIVILENESGLLIMLGKVNLIQCEVLIMVCCQVMGNDVVVNIGGVFGNFEFNVYCLMVIYNFLQLVCLLVDGMVSFNEYCVVGIELNCEWISQLFNELLMLVIVLNIYIGYDKVVEIVKKVYYEGLIFKVLVLVLGYLMEVEFDSWVCLEEMVGSLVICQLVRGVGVG